METVKPLIEEKQHEPDLVHRTGSMRLFADPTRLEQVLVNLLTNAAKYTDEGGHITLTAQHDGKVVVTVKDDGVGIPPEMFPASSTSSSRLTGRSTALTAGSASGSRW